MKSYETAFRGGIPDRELLASLHATHAAFFEGGRPAGEPRPVIRESWLRVRRAGLDPVQRGLPGEKAPPPLVPDPDAHGGVVSGLVPLLRAQLSPLLDGDEMLLVVSDGAGTVVGRAGGSSISRRADELGFRPGVAWSERAVGTNAIGTALATGAPVHVHAAEHFSLAHHRWSCAAAPVVDPRSGRALGVVDLSLRAEQSHSTIVALAATLARQSELALRDAHRRSLGRLRDRTRTTDAPGRWVLVDSWGWVADASTALAAERVILPERVGDAVIVEDLGLLQARPVDGGWLLVERGQASPDSGIRIAFDGLRCTVTTCAEGNEWTHVFVGRRAEILQYLADRPEGVTAQDVARDVYHEAEAEVSVRAEVHRIRRTVGGLVTTRPYRLSPAVRVTA